MSYEIVLEAFSGPLDLLLHLIQKHEIDIHDIPISTVTEQYLEYLRAMEELSLEVASEFVVMAATLLAIKSRTLLPRPPRGENEEEETDPREPLVEQLLEYQRCKWAAERLKARELLQSQLFSREPMDLRPYVPNSAAPLTGVSMWDLVDSYRKLLLRIPKQQQVAEIKGNVIAVEDMMHVIVERMQRFKRATFAQLLQFAQTRPEVVSAFLALLELVKDRVVKCVQPSLFGEIEILLCEEI
ncbi:segregation/condensation protein A [Alicyclobacillus tolerans]|uniref:segregation and condensation protein A n=1 Tax=Alicyclobacillus tolerans TaxID=90970 RepID=UPI001F36EB4F|nr:segregation/condensation protein A [Alicyclobacillus tolerans]MCF8563685.1 segregation/condensation protein A [Alicyclobacillus tolerans]